MWKGGILQGGGHTTVYFVLDQNVLYFTNDSLIDTIPIVLLQFYACC